MHAVDGNPQLPGPAISMESPATFLGPFMRSKAQEGQALGETLTLPAGVGWDNHLQYLPALQMLNRSHATMYQGSYAPPRPRCGACVVCKASLWLEFGLPMLHGSCWLLAYCCRCVCGTKR